MAEAPLAGVSMMMVPTVSVPAGSSVNVCVTLPSYPPVKVVYGPVKAAGPLRLLAAGVSTITVPMVSAPAGGSVSERVTLPSYPPVTVV